MSRWVLFFASGNSFYVGLALLGIAALLGSLARGRLHFGSLLILSLLAVTSMSLSATLSGKLQAALFLFVLAWLFAEAFRPARGRVHVALRCLLVATCVALGGWELRYSVVPQMPAGPFSRVYVIGDSLSAGIGTAGVTPWPQLLRQEHGIELVDLARAGATIASATKLIAENPLSDGLVILEIGGNDLIGRSSSDEFESQLDSLLNQVSGRDRAIVMFELPLLPHQVSVGHAQRRVARKHGVRLIPKRILAGVLAEKGATLDGLHLSASGHRAMAELMWGLLGNSLTKRSASGIVHFP